MCHHGLPCQAPLALSSGKASFFHFQFWLWKVAYKVVWICMIKLYIFLMHELVCIPPMCTSAGVLKQKHYCHLMQSSHLKICEVPGQRLYLCATVYFGSWTHCCWHHKEVPSLVGGSLAGCRLACGMRQFCSFGHLGAGAAVNGVGTGGGLFGFSVVKEKVRAKGSCSEMSI